jgi:hypothetical protein
MNGIDSDASDYCRGSAAVAEIITAAGGANMVYDNFLSFTRGEVLTRRASNPGDVRLDGATSGGSRDVVGQFRHGESEWVVHADSHYEPLLIAYEAAEAGVDPFVEESTERGRCLTLTRELRAQQRSRHKYLYIYSWSPAAEPPPVAK